MEKNETKPNDREVWAGRIGKAIKDFKNFWDGGDAVVKTYRIEDRNAAQQEKYNILFSNTETIKPTLYAQRPKPQVSEDQRDGNNPIARGAAMALERTLEYVLDQQNDDFDAVMSDVVQDLLLPGLGTVWCRYEPTMRPLMDLEGQPVLNEAGEPEQEVAYETVVFDYVFWKDIIWNTSRRWSEVWWIARAAYMDKKAVEKRFGKKVAEGVSFSMGGETRSNRDNQHVEDGQARIWEIWDKKANKVYWFCDTYASGFLDVKDDPLKLEHFFPTPRPLFAITTTNKTIPRPYYSQYQAQADELNDITSRIRKLVDALRVIGVYDASVPALANLLSGKGNKMVGVENYATLSDKGGLKGAVDFLGIQEIAAALMQLYDARERVKGEIYEITGWSDIIRGVSKASETLGAQKLKSEWAGSRLKLAQRDVQRFIRDLFRIAGEIISEHFDKSTIALAAGIQFAAGSQEEAIFDQVLQALRSDKTRCMLIDVETDSMLMPDEANDKAERMEFLGAAGAFLQQAVPAIQSNPGMAPLLGEILMFTVRSFRAARPLEEKFQQFSQIMSQMGGQGQANGENGSNPAEAQAKMQAAQIQAQQKAQAENTKAQIAQAELQEDARQHNEDIALEREKEVNRHTEAMLGLDIKAAAEENRQEAEQVKTSLQAEGQQVDMQFRSRDADRADKQALQPKTPKA